MSSVPQIEFDLQPKQHELLKLVDTPHVVNIGYGGPRGGGKSRGIRDIMLIRRFKYPKTMGWLIRRTFDELYDNHIEKYFFERPYMRAWYNTQHKEFILPNQSIIKARYAEHEGDLESEYGKEAMDIFIDQAEQFSERENNFLRTCRRFPGVPDGQCKMVSTINPGGISHAYMKRVFIDKQYVDNEHAKDFGFIPASGWDNVEWCLAALREDDLTVADFYGWTEEQRFEYFIRRSEYGRALNALPETMRIQQLLGRWDYFEGQVFPELGAVHDLDKYITPDARNIQQLAKGLKLIGCLDHATTGITAYLLTGVDVDNNLIAFDQYYKQNRLIAEHAEGIKDLKSNYPKLHYELADPSTEAKTMQNRDELFSVQDAYRREGLHLLSASRGSIAVGIDRIKTLLRVDPQRINPFTQQRGSPSLFISRSRCPDLWKEMTELQLIDGEFVGADHLCDDLRYIAMSRPAPPKPKVDSDALMPNAIPQMVVRSHSTWAKQFDKKIKSGGGGKTYW